MLEDVKHIHMLGIGGIGISGVARILAANGLSVGGSDVRQSSITDALNSEGIPVTIGHDAANIDGADLVVVSTAIPETNPELVAAKEQGVRIVHRSEILSAISERYKTIGVTGTHGKGTVSSMIAWILECAGLEPGFVIGGMLNNFGTNARPGGGEWMVLEIDESDGTHLNFRPNYVVCNYLELDHLNYYENLDDIIATMQAFVETNPKLHEAFINVDCAGNRDLVENINMRLTGYSTESTAEYTAERDTESAFPLKFEAKRRAHSFGNFELNLPGSYNITNALAAISVCSRVGVSNEVMQEALRTYRGLENRFTIEENAGVRVVKDYNSHPTCMRKVLDSARDLSDGRIVSVFKPYRYTLIKYLSDEYATAFNGSDEVIITTMYAAEEDPIPGIDTEFVVNKIRENGLKVTHIVDQGEINSYLWDTVKEGDNIIFFGGDDFFRMADQFLAKL